MDNSKTKNPRALRKKKLTDKEYLDKIANRDNFSYLYAQGEEIKDDY